MQPRSAILDQGLYEGLDWLAHQVIVPADERQMRRNTVEP
jgi:hypothetical protein